MALGAILSLFSRLRAPSLEGKPPAASLELPFLRHAATHAFWRLQVFVWLPIVMLWRAMTTTSD